MILPQVLELLHIPQVRPLPRINKTEKKDENRSPSAPSNGYSQALKIFGPFMQEWKYSFPGQSNGQAPSPTDVLKYKMLKKLRLLYVKYGKYGFLRKATAHQEPY